MEQQWNYGNGNSKNTIEDAKEVCQKLGIEHHIFDAQKCFEQKVIKDFIQMYEKAQTPNPCIECNKYIKFGYFYEKAKELNCDYIATGHYAKIEYSNKYKQYVLKKSKEESKDQTYFLYTIPKEILEHIIFPLEDCNSKEEIRRIAKQNNLKVAEKKDSQEICFIEDNDYKRFLKEKIITQPKKGNIILKTGEILGKHNGLINYTIGQRKGIRISYKEPLYIIELRLETNEVVVGTKNDLYSNTLYAKKIDWQVDTEKEMECLAKIRYRSKESKAKVTKDENGIVVKFEEPQRAITKGQSIVLYDDNGIVLGGGKIS